MQTGFVKLKKTWQIRKKEVNKKYISGNCSAAWFVFYEAEIRLVPKYRNKTWCQIYFSEKAWKNDSVFSQLSLYSSVHVEKLLALQ